MYVGSYSKVACAQICNRNAYTCTYRFLLIWLEKERIPIPSNANIVDMTKLEAIVLPAKELGWYWSLGIMLMLSH